MRLPALRRQCFFGMGKGRVPNCTGLFLGSVQISPGGFEFITCGAPANGRAWNQSLPAVIQYGDTHLGWKDDLCVAMASVPAAPVVTAASTAAAAAPPLPPLGAPSNAVAAPQALLVARTPVVMQVVCPPGVAAGGEVHIQAPSGQAFAVHVPAGVSPGQGFHVTVPSAPPAVRPPRHRLRPAHHRPIIIAIIIPSDIHMPARSSGRCRSHTATISRSHTRTGHSGG
eukprot:COSAG01_NODE_190_length_22595_cov_16.442301_4_plen_227_part_00